MTMTGKFSREVVDLIWSRDQGRCVDCGGWVRRDRRGYPGTVGGWSVQHRVARGAGGVSRRALERRPWLILAAAGVVMCGDGVTGCHGRAETRDRARAYDLGFAIRDGMLRADQSPILHAVHGWVLLDDQGGWVPVEAPEGVAA